MEKNIQLLGKKITYTVRKSTRARNVRLTVYPGGKVIATWPRFISETSLEKFIREKGHWLIATIERLALIQPSKTLSQQRREYIQYKEIARKLAQERLEHYNQFYNFDYNRISIRNQQTRWGSCSTKKNLNFNYKISLLPLELCDYIIVHELCHLMEMNHSSSFWRLVSQTIPNHRYLRHKLRQWHLPLD